MQTISSRSTYSFDHVYDTQKQVFKRTYLMHMQNGKTPLMWAAEGGFTECVRVLLAAPGNNPLLMDKVLINL